MLDYLACIQIISIHALREEGDTSAMSAQTDTILFLSTPSARRATPYPLGLTDQQQNFYPRPPRGGRRGVQIPSLAPK